MIHELEFTAVNAFDNISEVTLLLLKRIFSPEPEKTSVCTFDKTINRMPAITKNNVINGDILIWGSNVMRKGKNIKNSPSPSCV